MGNIKIFNIIEHCAVDYYTTYKVDVDDYKKWLEGEEPSNENLLEYIRDFGDFVDSTEIDSSTESYELDNKEKSLESVK